MKKQNFCLFGISPLVLQHSLENFLEKLGIKMSNFNIDQSSDFGELKLTIEYHQNQISLYSQLFQLVNESFEPYIYAENELLPECIIKCLKNRKETLSLAESCTGGMISSQITKISGASSVFDTGIVTYSNASKMNLLSVDERLLIKYGAVSKQTAKAMVSGLLHTTHSDYGIAVTGIAGPTGGTPEKPNGTVYIGWGSRKSIHTQHFLIPLSRLEFQKKVTSTAIHQLIRYVLKADTAINYYFDHRSSNSNL